MLLIEALLVLACPSLPQEPQDWPEPELRSPLTIEALAQQAYLKASNPGQSDVLGFSVAMSGDTVVVGARWEDSNATGVDGDQANNDAVNSGAAYVFVREGGTWSQQAYLKASDSQAQFQFGWSVAISGDTVVIGAAGAGAAYVFVREGDTWSEQARLPVLGSRVAVSGDTVVVGAVGGVGSAYVFVRSGSSWSQEALLQASNPDFFDRFGISVAIDGDLLVVGANEEDSHATGVNGNQMSNVFEDSGAAYVFRRTAGSWSQEAYLKASNTGSEDSFGLSVGIAGEVVVVGAPLEDSDTAGVNGSGAANNNLGDSGAVYVFRRVAGAWSQEAHVKASIPEYNDHFGDSVALSEDLIAIGAPHFFNSLFTSDSGASYVFEHDGSAWSQQAHLTASNMEAADRFGDCIAVSGTSVAVGAPQEDSSASGVNGDQNDNSLGDAGAAYVFQTGVLSAVSFRNAGSNPASYAADPIVIGGSFTASVDNNLPAQVASLLFAFDGVLSLPLAGGQTLLCLDLGSGELFTGANLAPTSSAAGVDGYSLAVPNDPSLAGFIFSSQAIQYGSPPFALSNALDFTIGTL